MSNIQPLTPKLSIISLPILVQKDKMQKICLNIGKQKISELTCVVIVARSTEFYKILTRLWNLKNKKTNWSKHVHTHHKFVYEEMCANNKLKNDQLRDSLN